MRRATKAIRIKRAEVVAEVPNWQDLRLQASGIKRHALQDLGRHLQDLEASVIKAGGQVHWALDAAEANSIAIGLVKDAGAQSVVKVKSLTTDEIGLNDALETASITAVETDLAELIVQLANDSPSHILVPAIHKNRSEIRTTFLQSMPGVSPTLSDSPADLADAARRYLRGQFLEAKVAISGANFACADTGTVAVVESEGNGRMCLTLPSTLITVMGIEKVIPSFAELSIFLELLPRSSTGERMNPYTSLWTGVTKDDGPSAFHLILLDNGRSRILDDTRTTSTLACIRCSACLNVCPVYERIGGHAYGSVYPGPIGAILTPQLVSAPSASGLAYASTLCGACYEVCPVMIDIPDILIALRARATTSNLGYISSSEKLSMKFLGWILRSRLRYEMAQKAVALLSRLTKGKSIPDFPGALHPWTVSRDTPPLPESSFRTWWHDEMGN